VVNDTDAAGMAEARFGAGRDAGGVVAVITLGTGIGSAPSSTAPWCPRPSWATCPCTTATPRTGPPTRCARTKELSWKKYAARLQEYLELLEREHDGPDERHGQA
jgi:polyphosphate glucokinase